MLECCALGRKQGGRNRIGGIARDFLAGLFIFIIIFALAALDAGPVRSQSAAGSAARTAHAGQQDRSLTPAQMRSGALLIRGTGADTSAYSEALLVDTDAVITIDGPVARAVVTQTFRNTGEKDAEGIYVFPLPGEAAVDTLAMQIGTRAVSGEIIPRDKARQLYAGAQRAEAQPAGPASGATPNMFTSTVTSVPAGETVMVRIEYQQVLKLTDDGYSLRFPLVATPRTAHRPLALGVRYAVPRDGARDLAMQTANTQQQTDRGRTEPVSLQVKLQSGFPLGTIESVNHAAAIERLGEDGALLRIRSDNLPVDRDFVLKWAPRKNSEPTATLFRQQFGKSEYVLAMLNPPSEPAALARQPREVIFVVDTSGSMAGSAILQMRQSIEAAIARLDQNDRFNIIAFDSTYESLFKTPVPADEKGKAIATQFIDRLIASGATDVLRPLTAALQDERPEDTGRVRQVVLITDGAFNNEQKLFSEIAVRRGRSRLFLVGIGPVPQVNMLRRASEVGRGSHLHIASTHDVGPELDRFLTRLEQPAITDIKVEWPKGLRAETLPDPIPDVYAGAPQIFSARSEGVLKGKVTLTGNFAGKPWRKEIEIEAANKGHGLARLWARRKIASLDSHGYYARQDGGDVSAQIEKVALEHHIVSRMTRLVAFDKPSPAVPPQRLALASENAPLARPHGLVHNGAIDLAQETLEKRRGSRIYAATQGRPTPRMVIAPRIADKPVPGVASATAQDADQPAPVDLARQAQIKPIQVAQAGRNPLAPIAGQPAGQEPLFTARMGVIAIMALIFATMSALTLGLWRQFGRLHAADDKDNRRGK